MLVLVEAQNLVTLFLGLELLSIPLYVLCATELRRETSLESGLKYLVIGSVGSATLLYGLAFIYGAAGSTDFSGIAEALGADGSPIDDPLFLTGLALALTGLAFKASVAPFHQWTPDVYEGAPTAITAFMATATKAAALGVTIRFLDVAVDRRVRQLGAGGGRAGGAHDRGRQRRRARAVERQAHPRVVGRRAGGLHARGRRGRHARWACEATVFYLFVYLVMNLAAFAVVVARERETTLGDDMSALAGIGGSRPLLAWPMTIAMLGLAGIPATAGFIGKINLIGASVDGDYTWLGVFIVVGSMISLAYYLRIVAAMWMSPGPQRAAVPAMAGGSVGGRRRPRARHAAPRGLGGLPRRRRLRRRLAGLRDPARRRCSTSRRTRARPCPGCSRPCRTDQSPTPAFVLPNRGGSGGEMSCSALNAGVRGRRACERRAE